MADHVLVVIGVGGIGAAIARRSGTGCRLVLADRDPGVLSAIAEALTAEGYAVATQVVDVADRPSVQALAETASASGVVTGVVHTAGVSPTQAAARAIFAVDLVGTAIVLNEFARVMAEGGVGVVISSMAGTILGGGLGQDVETALAITEADELLKLPAISAHLSADSADLAGARSLAYAIAKRGNQLRVRAMAPVWGDRGARLNSISPGLVSTAMGRAEFDDPGNGHAIRSMVDASALHRIGTAADIASVADFLLGPQSGFITGTDVLVDGGVVAALTAGRFVVSA